ncbi:MAG: hypothetical protein IJ213_03230 [Bacteroidales bacterium]|nr:hypothetical protein [Bacteroidales bacterium]
MAYNQNVFSLADKYFEDKDYSNAVLEYERVYFYAQNSETQKLALQKKALSYKKRGKYLLSAQTLERIPLYAMNLEEKDSVFYEKLLCFYLADDFISAENLLKNKSLDLEENSSNKTLLMEILVYNQLGNYSKAKDKLSEYYKHTSYLSDEDKSLLDNLYQNPPKQKKESTAKLLSFIPGLGHIYSGYWFEGFSAFVVNGGILAFGIYEVWKGDYITVWVAGAGLLSAAYTGQQKRAVYLSKKYNYLKNKSFNNEIKYLLLPTLKE